MSATNTQFSVGVHIMATLDHYSSEEMITLKLAEKIQANPAFVRRVVAKLAKAGLVITTKGRSGFCRLARSSKDISLLEIYTAVQSPSVFSIHSYPSDKSCVVSSNFKSGMETILSQSQSQFERNLSNVMLSQLKNWMK